MNVLEVLKQCTLCGEIKTEEHFIKVPGGKYGLSSRCKPCRVKKYQDWYRSSGKAWIAEWKLKNRGRITEQARSYRAANPEASREATKRYENANPDVHRIRARRNRLQNPEMYRERGSKRRAIRSQANVHWARAGEIYRFYAEAVRRSTLEGIAYEVDHIVPLKHPKVCGLHNEFNLQVITSTANKVKGNRVWPGMP